MKKLIAEEALALFGRYNLDARIERGSLQREIDAIHVHPDWRAFTEKFDADIAVLVLKSPVDYTNNIQPICLPASSDPIGKTGTVVGWGLSELTANRPHESIPRSAIVNSANDSYCYTKDPKIALISSTRTFCAGGEGSRGVPCKGDSGQVSLIFKL